MTAQEKRFQILYNEARIAGLQAVSALNVVPMIVAQHTDVLNDNSPVRRAYFVADGPCGFAWIMLRVRRGKTDYDNTLTAQFSNWIKKNDLGHYDDYRHGVSIWVSEFRQSIQMKEAYAHAFAQVLRNANIRAYSESRMD